MLTVLIILAVLIVLVFIIISFAYELLTAIGTFLILLVVGGVGWIFKSLKRKE